MATCGDYLALFDQVQVNNESILRIVADDECEDISIDDDLFGKKEASLAPNIPSLMQEWQKLDAEYLVDFNRVNGTGKRTSLAIPYSFDTSPESTNNLDFEHMEHERIPDAVKTEYLTKLTKLLRKVPKEHQSGATATPLHSAQYPEKHILHDVHLMTELRPPFERASRVVVKGEQAAQESAPPAPLLSSSEVVLSFTLFTPDSRPTLPRQCVELLGSQSLFDLQQAVFCVHHTLYNNNSYGSGVVCGSSSSGASRHRHGDGSAFFFVEGQLYAQLCSSPRYMEREGPPTTVGTCTCSGDYNTITTAGPTTTATTTNTTNPTAHVSDNTTVTRIPSTTNPTHHHTSTTTNNTDTIISSASSLTSASVLSVHGAVPLAAPYRALRWLLRSVFGIEWKGMDVTGNGGNRSGGNGASNSGGSNTSNMHNNTASTGSDANNEEEQVLFVDATTTTISSTTANNGTANNDTTNNNTTTTTPHNTTTNTNTNANATTDKPRRGRKPKVNPGIATTANTPATTNSNTVEGSSSSGGVVSGVVSGRGRGRKRAAVDSSCGDVVDNSSSAIITVEVGTGASSGSGNAGATATTATTDNTSTIPVPTVPTTTSQRGRKKKAPIPDPPPPTTTLHTSTTLPQYTTPHTSPALPVTDTDPSFRHHAFDFDALRAQIVQGERSVDISCSKDVRLSALHWQLGVPYLYAHAAGCEHILYLTNVRTFSARYDSTTNITTNTTNTTNTTSTNASAINTTTNPTPTENASSVAYPVETYRARGRQRRCSVCDTLPAVCVVYEDRLADCSPCLFCEHCYHMLHYSAQGQLLYDDFHVFPYTQDP